MTRYEELDAQTLRNIKATSETALARITSLITHARIDDSYSSRRKQTALAQQLTQEITAMRTALGADIKAGVLVVAEYATEDALAEMRRLGMMIPEDDAFFYKYNRATVIAAHKDTFQHVAAMTDNIDRSVKQMLRQDTAAISRRAAVEGLSRKNAYKLLKDSILTNDPSFEFRDRRGRVWATKDYLNMLTRTAMANTQRDAYADTLIQSGHDLVKVSQHGAKDACGKWEGRVLSLTGATPGYPTVAEAKATNEIFHPRCRHRLLTYHPES